MAVGAFFCVPYLSFLKDERLDRFAGQLRSLIIPPAVVQWLREEVVASDVTEQAARAQTLRRYQIKLDRLQTRLDVLYEDRLDGGSMPTHTTKRPRKFVGISKMAECQSADLVPAAEAVNLMALTSEAADLFERQCASEQRRLLPLVMREAIWQDGELRTSFRELFEKLQLSNSATLTKDEDLSANEAISITGGEGGIRNTSPI